MKRDRDAILNEPNTFWIGGGDYAEFIGFGDTKRFDPDAVARQWRELASALARPAEKTARLFWP